MVYLINRRLPLYLNICWECESMKKIVSAMGCACTAVLIIREKLKKCKEIAYFDLNFPVRHNSPAFPCTLTKPGEYWVNILFQSSQKLLSFTSYTFYKINIWNRANFVIFGSFLSFGGQKRVKYWFLTNVSFITFNQCKKTFHLS